LNIWLLLVVEVVAVPLALQSVAVEAVLVDLELERLYLLQQEKCSALLLVVVVLGQGLPLETQEVLHR
jgi:hypothetical protein